MAENGNRPEGESVSAASPLPVTPHWLMKALTRVHVWLNRLTGGRYFNTLSGDDVCFVTMIGAKSGRTITTPLMYVPYSAGVLLIASKGGAPRNPMWYYNIVKTPEIEVRHRTTTMKLVARLAAAEEKSTLWAICDRHYAAFADYRQRTTRDIPIFICEPR